THTSKHSIAIIEAFYHKSSKHSKHSQPSKHSKHSHLRRTQTFKTIYQKRSKKLNMHLHFKVSGKKYTIGSRVDAFKILLKLENEYTSRSNYDSKLEELNFEIVKHQK